jgi:hypothetical protein
MPGPIEPINLTEDELVQASGGHTQPRRQLGELQRRGFWRAKLNMHARVDLERAHYLAVCAGALPLPTTGEARDTARPSVQPLRRKAG